ncbi:MAG: N-acetylmuramoyl-L-alanine amidase [Actinomycetota bacterium]|nr:N-acetylmuramoyl-L-alanine amidase [Actinomycetota bacterium]
MATRADRSRPRATTRSRRRRRAARRLPVAGALVIAAVVGAGAAWNHLAGPAAAAGPVPVDASRFASGACMLLPPTGGDRHVTVFLDAGHGGPDPGGVGTAESGQQVGESSVNLGVELDAATGLRARGFTVVVSRTADTTVLRLGPADTDGSLLTVLGVHDDVAARDQCADEAHAAALVGIYMDAGGSPSEAGSVTTYDTARTFAAANERLATLLQRDVLAAMNARGWDIPDDGVVPDTAEGSVSGDPSTGGLAAKAAAYPHLLLLGPAEAGYFTSPSRMPGAVIEPLYLTDPFEASIAATATGQSVIAQGITDAVVQYFAPVPARSGTGAGGR